MTDTLDLYQLNMKLCAVNKALLDHECICRELREEMAHLLQQRDRMYKELEKRKFRVIDCEVNKERV